MQGMSKRRENRPDLSAIESSSELRRWYWLKSELETHAKALGLRSTGGKFTILDRIAHYLDTGETVWPGDKKSKPVSKFDWHSVELTLETVVTDSYKNSQNVRRFFKAHAGADFKFNIRFMNNIRFMKWMRENSGKTLREAVAAYLAQKKEAAQPGFQSDIAHHNQFNQYTRDFLADNPELGMGDVRKYWALKRYLPSETGRHVYEQTDLDLD